MKAMKSVKTSLRLESIQASPIRKLVPLSVAAKKKGIKVYHLNIGDPDIKTPKLMLDILHKWDQNPISYSQSQGEPVFLEAMKEYYHRIGFKFIRLENIQATSGGSEAISMALFAITEPGDEIITFEPFYTNYDSYAAINGLKLKAIPTSAASGFHLPRKQTIINQISKKTKVILICNPNNPTGTVYSKQEMEMLVEIAKEFGLFILCDEVYREYVYDGKKHVSLFEYMKEIPDRAIVLDSLSKRYSLCGARLGTLVSLNQKVMAGVLRIAQGRLSVGLIDQKMASVLNKIPNNYLNEVIDEYKERRDVLYTGLKKIKGVVIPKPEGAFYTIVGLPVRDAEDFCRYLLTDFNLNGETVMLAPANGFYATKNAGKNEVRIAYVLNTSALKKAIRIIEEALKKYRV